MKISDYTDRMPIAAKTSHLRRLPGKPAPMRPAPPKIEAPWSLRTVRGLQILELALFRKFPWLIHGFSSRTGGASTLESGERVLNLCFTAWGYSEMVIRKSK